MQNANQRRHLGTLKMLAESGVDVPTLRNQPVVREWARPYWTAFELLSDKRIVTETGPQPIQMSEILAYADFHDIKDELRRDDLLHMTTVLDKIWREHVYEQRRRQADKERRRGADRQRR